MSTFLRDWITSCVSAALVCAIARELTPPGRVRTVQGFICAVVMALAVLSPVFSLDTQRLSIDIAKYSRMAEEQTRRAGDISDSLSRTVIQEEMRAYILDKAAQLGSEVYDAEAVLRWSGEGVWYPTGVKISGKYDRALSQVIAAELGVDEERQEWSEK